MLIGSALALAIVVRDPLAAWFRRNRPGVPGVRDGDRAALASCSASGSPCRSLVLVGALPLRRHLPDPQTTVPTASAAAADQPRLTVRVIGHQFWWEVRYPGTTAVTANEIHIPVRTPCSVLVRPTT